MRSNRLQWTNSVRLPKHLFCSWGFGGMVEKVGLSSYTASHWLDWADCMPPPAPPPHLSAAPHALLPSGLFYLDSRGLIRLRFDFIGETPS